MRLKVNPECHKPVKAEAKQRHWMSCRLCAILIFIGVNQLDTIHPSNFLPNALKCKVFPLPSWSFISISALLLIASALENRLEHQAVGCDRLSPGRDPSGNGTTHKGELHRRVQGEQFGEQHVEALTVCSIHVDELAIASRLKCIKTDQARRLAVERD